MPKLGLNAPYICPTSVIVQIVPVSCCIIRSNGLNRFLNPFTAVHNCRLYARETYILYKYIQNHNYLRDLHKVLSCLFETFGSMSEIMFLAHLSHSDKVAIGISPYMALFNNCSNGSGPLHI